MSELMLRSLFDDDFFSMFGAPTKIRFSTNGTKDMMPVCWSKWYEKAEDADGKEIKTEKGYKATVRTVGVDADDIKVTLENSGIVVEGCTEVDGCKYSQYVELPISKEVLSLIEDVTYRSKDGLTYVYLKTQEPKHKKIQVTRI